MTEFENTFIDSNNLLRGRIASVDEVEELKRKFKDLYPSYLINVILKSRVIGESFSLSYEYDQSEMGVELEWMTPKSQIEECFSNYPGISALKLGFIPVGICLEGSGDPYFINTNDKEPKLYRVPHDSVVEDSISIDQIEYVCELKNLIKHLA
ncbi:MAG: hypothetical protein RLO12_21720 [Fulvivirga sp.]